MQPEYHPEPASETPDMPKMTFGEAVQVFTDDALTALPAIPPALLVSGRGQ